MKNMNEKNRTPPATKRISSIFMIVAVIMLVLSAAALFQVLESSIRGTLDIINLILSISAIALSLYMLLQMRTKTLKLGFEPPKVVTTVECLKCGQKNTRDFQQGDFIVKRVEPCPKCNEPMMISSVFRLPEEKEKK